MLRDKKTDHRQFRELVCELAILLGYEATRDLQLKPATIETPLAETEGAYLREENVGHQLVGSRVAGVQLFHLVRMGCCHV